MKNRAPSILALSGFVAAVCAAAMVGSLARPDRWYRRLRKPAFTPPNSIFGPVWTALYGLLALSAWRVGRAPQSPERTRALRLWGAQLALNAAWSPRILWRPQARHGLG